MAKPVSILLVDDEERNLVALESILDSPEYRLVKARTADEALIALMNNEFAAMVLDIQMPDLSGIELAKLIKQRKKTQHIPIIFLTAYYQEEEHVVLGYDVGAVDYLTKPANPSVLRSKVSVFVDLFRKTRALAEINSAMADEIIERQRAEQRFRMVVESAPNAMVVVNREGFITLANMQAELLFGYRREELIEQPADILVPAEFSLVPGEVTLKQVESEAPRPGREVVGRRKDGTEVPIEIGLNPILGPDGNSILASIVDITERKAAEAKLRAANAELAAKNAELQRQAEERVRRIRAEAAQAEAEAARERSTFLAEASSILAASFNYHQTLQAFVRLFVPKLADCCVIDVVHEDGIFSPLAVAHRDSHMEEEMVKYRRNFPMDLNRNDGLGAVLKNGSTLVCPEFPLPARTEGEPAKNRNDEAFNPSPEETHELRELGIKSFMVIPLKARGKVLGSLTFFSTGSRRYREGDVPLGKELAERAGLALDNARLYLDAGAAREAAEAANAAKDRFLAMLSHELRTPLSPVLHSVTLLEGEAETTGSAREALATIRRNVQLEARLIDDLLDLARIRNAKLQLHREPADAHDLLHRTLEICQAEVRSRRLQVKLDLAATQTRLHADPARIQQIFWNIITNALKFSPTGAELHIATFNGPKDSLHIEMTDQGRGIAPEKLERIFDAFEQAEGHRQSGLGLGLAICRALVGLHGGSIEARSEGLGHGATFVITLPLATGAELEARSEPASPTSSAPLPLRLLLVEDHVDTAAALNKLLVRRGYEVRSAESVSQAMEVAAEFDFDVLVSDIGLPDGTGVDLFQRLAARPGKRAFRGIALSGYGMQEDLERSSAAGFSHHLTKPVDFPLLDRMLITVGQDIERVAG